MGRATLGTCGKACAPSGRALPLASHAGETAGSTPGCGSRVAAMGASAKGRLEAWGRTTAVLNGCLGRAAIAGAGDSWLEGRGSVVVVCSWPYSTGVLGRMIAMLRVPGAA